MSNVIEATRSALGMLGLMLLTLSVTASAFWSAPVSASVSGTRQRSERATAGRSGGSVPGRLSLRIAASDGVYMQVIQGAVITVWERSGVMVAQGFTDARGFFSVELNEGVYKVQVDTQSYATYTAEAGVKPASDTGLYMTLN